MGGGEKTINIITMFGEIINLGQTTFDTFKDLDNLIKQEIKKKDKYIKYY
jgi:hypothetical protein